MELNWQKSQCVKVRTTDERTKSELRVCKWNFLPAAPLLARLDEYAFGSSCVYTLQTEVFKQ